MTGEQCRIAIPAVRQEPSLLPWKTSSVMEEKLRFVFDYERDEHSIPPSSRSRFGV
jgi:hypothetical protein